MIVIEACWEFTLMFPAKFTTAKSTTTIRTLESFVRNILLIPPLCWFAGFIAAFYFLSSNLSSSSSFKASFDISAKSVFV
jgi:hypothetical protein